MVTHRPLGVSTCPPRSSQQVGTHWHLGENAVIRRIEKHLYGWGYEAVLVEYLERCAETHRRWLLISIGVQFFIP